MTDTMPKLSTKWCFADKYYGAGTEKYRDNWDKIFKRAAGDKDDVEKLVPTNMEVSCHGCRTTFTTSEDPGVKRCPTCGTEWEVKAI